MCTQFVCTAQWLMGRGVNVYTIDQRPGQHAIIKPGVIHWGLATMPGKTPPKPCILRFRIILKNKELKSSPGYTVSS